jgi:hypothetical protein
MVGLNRTSHAMHQIAEISPEINVNRRAPDRQIADSSTLRLVLISTNRILRDPVAIGWEPVFIERVGVLRRVLLVVRPVAFDRALVCVLIVLLLHGYWRHASVLAFSSGSLRAAVSSG